MNNSVSVSRASSVSFSDQPVVGLLGLKRSQWQQRSNFQTMARDRLEALGANVTQIRCYLKTGQNYTPSTNPDIINVFLKLGGQNKVEVIS